MGGASIKALEAQANPGLLKNQWQVYVKHVLVTLVSNQVTTNV